MKIKKILTFIILSVIIVFVGVYGVTRIFNFDNQDLGNDELSNTLTDDTSESYEDKEKENEEVFEIVNVQGGKISERFLPPEGFERVSVEEGTFEEYLRTLPLKPHGSPVLFYDGREKPRNVHEAVIDMDIGDRNLQQCADAVRRLRAEYLYAKGHYDRIQSTYVNGFIADYATWMEGNRIVVEGNNAYWVHRAEYSNEYESFRKYLEMVFSYANTVTLEQELKSIDVEDMQIGDVFMKGPLPGHCVIVVDMAKNIETGEKLFMIAQSYMPAQDIHVLKNNTDDSISPWYSINFGEVLSTPEWTFYDDQLMRFDD
ncbi:DUF4846 domain-containing protein [Herbivorax sp. ANBcel31]|uniref:DUF4846 domain-containing protein n=1 Tax=Herbivorax sp. ANBcel31 TaxID=3069754 RepID=UPI0027B19DC3|nr:DUF4846 domain-containing protein [Herbivorax sp. ANBcel31]MDQ2087810.1 DUF4846 domain-containing protein [Herbivorax sp. ANBcel31]